MINTSLFVLLLMLIGILQLKQFAVENKFCP